MSLRFVVVSVYCLQWWSDYRLLVWSYDFEAKRIKDIFFVNTCLFSFVVLPYLVIQKGFFFFSSSAVMWHLVFSVWSETRSDCSCDCFYAVLGTFNLLVINLCDLITCCIWLCLSLQNVTCGKMPPHPKPLPFSFLLQPKMWRLNPKSRFSKIKPILGSINMSGAQIHFVWFFFLGGGVCVTEEGERLRIFSEV